jgi:hypothetical protein
MSYIFWCSKCKRDHAGECRSEQYNYVVKLIEELTAAGWEKVTCEADQLVLSTTLKLSTPLEFIPITFNIFRTGKDSEGWYGTAPLRECQRTHVNDLCCACDPSVCDHPICYDCKRRPGTACLVCSKIVCDTCAEEPYKFCCDS